MHLNSIVRASPILGIVFALISSGACVVQAAYAEQNWEIAFKAKAQFLCEWISARRVESNGVPRPLVCTDPSVVSADDAYDEVREYFGSWKETDPYLAGVAENQFNDAWDKRWSAIVDHQEPPSISALPLQRSLPGGADLSDDCRAHGLIEVRNLEQLPQGVASQLRRGDIDGRHYSKLDYIVGGMCADYVLIAFEAYDPQFPVHAMSLRSGPSGWSSTSETILGVRPHALSELKQMILSDDAKALTAQWVKVERWRYQKEIMAVEPSRRDGPFRPLNLSDDEVREIQEVMLKIMPGAILNISGVVSGCLCQDGPECSAQVWVLAHYPQTPERSKDLQLSDINSHWVIGPLQRWYLDSENLEGRHFPSRDAYNTARQALNDQFPACATQPKRAHN